MVRRKPVRVDSRHVARLPGRPLGRPGRDAGAARRARGFVLGCTWALLLGSAILLGLGVVALASGQPYGVWYGLGLPGLLGLVVIGANTFTVYWAYRAAEARKLAARDLTEPAGGSDPRVA